MSVRAIVLLAAVAVLCGCSGGGRGASPLTATSVPATATLAAPTTGPTAAGVVAIPAGCARGPAPADRVAAAAVSFVDGQRGFAIGWADDVSFTEHKGLPCTIAWATTDGGASWAVMAILPAPGLTGLRFTSAKDGWAYGTDALFVTHDGGRAWRAVALDGEIADFEATVMNAWVLERTPCPGGAPTNYTPRDQQRTGADPLPCPFELRLSSDGGATWRAPAQPPPAFAGQPVMGRNFGGGLIAERADPGTASVLWATGDAGETWTPLPPLTGHDGPIDIAITPTGDTYLLTVSQPAGTFQPKAVLRGTPRVTWETIADAVAPGGPAAVVGNLPLGGNARTFTVTPAAILMPTLRGALLASFDGGVTWSTPLGYNDVSPGDAAPGRAVCIDANCWLPVVTGVYRSADAGRTWTLARLPEP